MIDPADDVNNPFKHHKQGLESPATRCVPLENDASCEATRALMVATDGDIVVLFLDDQSEQTVPALKAGVVYPFRIRAVGASNATTIIGLY